MKPTLKLTDTYPWDMCYVQVDGSEPIAVDGVLSAIDLARTLWGERDLQHDVTVYECFTGRKVADRVATFHAQK